jgi:hypothetical protein
MESKIIYQIENFIAFLFGENNYNDPEQKIYNKLLRLEGKELDTWMNTKVKKYIIGNNFYFEKFDGIKGQTLFRHWYWDNIFKGTGKALSHHEIYGTSFYIFICEEFKNIKDKIQTFKKKDLYYHREKKWGYFIVMDYLEMFIMTKSSEDLKKYIIQLVDPVTPLKI